jgi:opacity protein-like surface antigen
MKKGAIAAVLILLLASSARAWDVKIGIMGGARTASDPDIRRIYGGGSIYYPFLSVGLVKGFSLGTGYEGGYSRSGVIGSYRETTTLKVAGPEIFAGYWFRLEPLSLYLKAGWGSYGYPQTVDSPAARDFPVDARRGALLVAGGLQVFFSERFYLCGEVKYVPLKVRPYDREVDLGGFRYMAGVGYAVRF